MGDHVKIRNNEMKGVRDAVKKRNNEITKWGFMLK